MNAGVELMMLYKAGYVTMGQIVPLKGLPLTLVVSRLTAMLPAGVISTEVIEAVAKQISGTSTAPITQGISDRMLELIKREERHKFTAAMTIIGASQYQLADIFDVARQTISDNIKRHHNFQSRASWKERAERAGIIQTTLTLTAMQEYYVAWQEYLTAGGLLASDSVDAALKLIQLRSAMQVEDPL